MRKDTQVPQPSGPTEHVADEDVHKERGDSLVRAATTASSLEAEVLDLETTKTTQANKIASLKRRVKKIERRNKLRTHGLKIIYRVGSSRRVESSKDEDMFGVSDLDGDEVIVNNADVVNTAEETRSMVKEITAVIEKDKLVSAAEETVNVAATTVSTASTIPDSAATTTATTTATITDVEITLAQALAELKSAKPKVDKIRLDEELAFKLQAKEEEEEERLAREKAHQTKEANIAWDDIQAKIEADYQLAQRLQAQEQEELTDEEKARFFVQFLKQRRKHFVAKRVENKRNRPPIRAQQRSIMCIYLKNMEGWKPKNLKNKSFANIQELFDKAMKRVNTFVDYRTELVEEKEVAIDVVPLATKPPTMVDWKIHKEGKKSYYQIIRADGKSQMYRVFSQILKSFIREDLEDLYKLVKAKYGLTRLVEDLDLILWGDLKIITVYWIGSYMIPVEFIH
ncbi:hypothetical protein Tco_0906975 [Tanacetum coccineum]|uniref:Uncharacterized protein n=1 Tax=Tanacetum coccineum TaxID=301880 RepID=A0ABQ5CHZ4_9ASTR